jgi:hypothetical protein
MIFYLLQDVQYFKQDDPVAATILIVGAASVALVVFVMNIVRHGLKVGKRGGGGAGNNPRRFSLFALRRVGKGYGLNGDQVKVLEYVFKSNGVIDPERVINSPAVLDKHFKRTYKQIENSANTEEEAQMKLAMLFSVRNTIEIVQNTRSQNSTQQLAANMAAVLTVNQESYNVKVISTKGDSVLVDCPRNAIGSLIRFPKGTRVTLAFFTKTNKGFSFNSQIIGTSDTSFGPALQLSHSGAAKAMTQRRFRRRQALLSCTYRTVRVEPARSKKEGPRMIVDARRSAGTVTDISIGGCSIKTSYSTPPGSRLKIEFDYSPGNLPTAVLGQVLRINRSGITSTIMHIKFLKVPRKAMNVINSIVFEYGE